MHVQAAQCKDLLRVVMLNALTQPWPEAEDAAGTANKLVELIKQTG